MNYQQELIRINRREFFIQAMLLCVACIFLAATLFRSTSVADWAIPIGINVMAILANAFLTLNAGLHWYATVKSAKAAA